MSQNSILIRAYLENVLAALSNEQPHAAEFLARHAFELLNWASPSSLPFLPVRLAYSIGLDTGITRARKPNEDYAFATQFVCQQTSSSDLPLVGGLFLVADGMGGHKRGADAAHLAIHTAVDCLLPQLAHGSLQEDAIPTLLDQGVQEANRAIYALNEQSETEKSEATAKMGTTLCVAVLLGTRLFVANVGDSRAYILRQGQPLRQVTRDHSAVSDWLASGTISLEDAATHPQRNQIYRCLGDKSVVEVDVFSEQFEDGDSVLLCSDGLWGMLPDVAQIEDVLGNRWLSTKRIVERLVQLARSGGGRDNISAIVVRLDHQEVQDMPTQKLAPLTPSTSPVVGGEKELHPLNAC